MTLSSTLNPAELFNNPILDILCSASLECQFFERKRQKEPREVASIISAFSNTNKAGGLIIIGVNDDGSMEGLSFLGQEWINKFHTTLDQQIPEPVYEFKSHMVTNKSGNADVIFLILVKYSPDKLIERSDGKAFRRVADNTRELSDEQKIEFKFAKGQLHYEEKCFTKYSSDDYDKGVVDQFLQGIKHRDGISLDDRPDQAFESKGIIKFDHGSTKHTSVGVLSLMKNPSLHIPGAKIRFVRYDGKEERSGQDLNIVKDETFEGSLPLLISKTFEFVKTQTKEFSYLDVDGRFIKEPEYPFSVILEAIVNAVVHRSYSLSNTPIFIKMFEDKISIESPGRFPGTVTPENFYHYPRNPKLMEVLRYFEYVKALSEGTKRMRQDMSKLNLPEPKFEELDDRVKVTLYNDIDNRKEKKEEAKGDAVEQYSNLFLLSVRDSSDQEVSSSYFDDGLEFNVRKSFVSSLIKSGWLIPSFGMKAFQNNNPLHVIEKDEKRIISILPGFKFGIRNCHGKLMLVIDPTIMIKSYLTVTDLANLGISGQQLLGLNAYDKAEKKSGRIMAVADHVILKTKKGNINAQKNNLIPNMKTHQIQNALNNLDINYNLDQECKKYSFLTTSGAPKIRAKRTIELAKILSEENFPLQIGDHKVALSSSPSKLSKPIFDYKSDLRDMEVSFDSMNRFKSEIVLNGITQYGSYDKPSKEIDIIPVYTQEVASNMNALISQVSRGSFKYKGIERTFGIKLIVKDPIICNKPEEYYEQIATFIEANTPPSKTLFFVYAPEGGYSKFDYKSPYYAVKQLLLSKGYVSQMVNEYTVRDAKFKDLNLGLDLFAKSGYTPWVLSEGFTNCDLFLGLSYSSIADISGQSRIIGYVNVFDRMGRWTFYEGSSQLFNYEDRKEHLKNLIGSVISSLQDQRNIKKIHIHHSSKLSREIKESIYEEVRRTIPSVEITYVWINSQTPIRMYDPSYYSDGSLKRGAYVITSPNQFYLSTTGYNNLRQSAIGTPQLLEVNVDNYPSSIDFDLKNIANQILALTKLNWASTKTFCHLPITLKFANDIAYLMNAIYKGFGKFELDDGLKAKPWFL